MRASRSNQAPRAVWPRRFARIARRILVRGIVALALLFGVALSAFDATDMVRAAEPPSLAALAGDDLLRAALYAAPRRLASGDAPDGAMSVNAAWERGERDTWFIEQQRYGADFVTAGLFTGDGATVERGWRILQWGFAHQGSDGDFPGTGDAYHSTSFFVEATARALLLMKQTDPERYASRIAELTPKVMAAAHWMLRPDVAAHGEANNQPYTHRRYLVAAALGETGALLGDRPLLTAAQAYARDGLALQTAEGVNPEKGGGDVNYQATGVLFAARYLTVCADSALRDDLAGMIAHALAWEAGKTDDTGTVDASDSTRTGLEAGRSGATKTVDYPTITQAFAFGSAVTGDASFGEVAARIAIGRGWVPAVPSDEGARCDGGTE